jgi:hypothetical protein
MRGCDSKPGLADRHHFASDGVVLGGPKAHDFSGEQLLLLCVLKKTTKWLDGFVSTGYGLQDLSALIFVDVGQSSLLLSSSVRPESCCSLQSVTKTVIVGFLLFRSVRKFYDNHDTQSIS